MKNSSQPLTSLGQLLTSVDGANPRALTSANNSSLELTLAHVDVLERCSGVPKVFSTSRVHYQLLTTLQQVMEIPAIALRKPSKPPTPLARAHARALAQTLLDLYRMDYPDKEVIESFKRAVLKLWKLRYEYYKDEPEFQELVRLGVLPPEP